MKEKFLWNPQTRHSQPNNNQDLFRGKSSFRIILVSLRSISKISYSADALLRRQSDHREPYSITFSIDFRSRIQLTLVGSDSYWCGNSWTRASDRRDWAYSFRRCSRTIWHTEPGGSIFASCGHSAIMSLPSLTSRTVLYSPSVKNTVR